MMNRMIMKKELKKEDDLNSYQDDKTVLKTIFVTAQRYCEDDLKVFMKSYPKGIFANYYFCFYFFSCIQW